MHPIAGRVVFRAVDHVVIRKLEHLTGSSGAPAVSFAVETRDRPGPAHKGGAFEGDVVYTQLHGGLIVARAKVRIGYVMEYSNIQEVRARTRGSALHGVADFWSCAPREQRDRLREIGRDPEVRTDAGQDLVDREGPHRSVELGRSPPVVALQRVITEIEEASVRAGGVERVLVHTAAEPGDAIPQQGLTGCARHQPRLLDLVLRDQRLDRRQRHDQISQAEGDRSDVGAAHQDEPRRPQRFA